MDPKPNLAIKPLLECDECKKISQKSGCPLWQFVILDLSSFGMIITEPSGLLYLALHERNLNTSWNTKVSNHVLAQCLCLSVFGHSMGFFSSTTSSLFGKSFLQYLGIWSACKDLSACGKGWTDPFSNDCDFKIVKNMWGGAAIMLLWLWWRWQISVCSKSYNIHKYHLDWNNFKRQMNRVWQLVNIHTYHKSCTTM